MNTTPPGLLSVKAFCNWAAIGRTKFYEEVQEGRLLTVTSGRRRLVPMVEAQRWLDQLLDAAAVNAERQS